MNVVINQKYSRTFASLRISIQNGQNCVAMLLPIPSDKEATSVECYSVLVLWGQCLSYDDLSVVA